MAPMKVWLRKLAAIAGLAFFAAAGGAQAQGQVNIICSVPITWCEALIAQFQKDTGIAKYGSATERKRLLDKWDKEVYALPK